MLENCLKKENKLSFETVFLFFSISHLYMNIFIYRWQKLINDNDSRLCLDGSFLYEIRNTKRSFIL